MADEKKKADGTDAAETSGPTRSQIVKSQAAYTGSEHSDLVEVTIIKDGTYYKKGDTDIVHPSLALILQAKGLIEGTGKEYTRPKFDQKDISVDL